MIAIMPSKGRWSASRHAKALAVRCNSSQETGKALSESEGIVAHAGLTRQAPRPAPAWSAPSSPPLSTRTNAYCGGVARGPHHGGAGYR